MIIKKEHVKLISLILIWVCINSCTTEPANKTGLEGKSIPDFDMLLLKNNRMLNTKYIPGGHPIVIFYFSTSCPYCRAQTKDIVNEINKTKSILFYMLGMEPPSEIKKYIAHFNLDNFSNIAVGQDHDSYFNKYYQVTGVPYMAIYGKDKKLKQVVTGNVSINKIKDIALN